MTLSIPVIISFRIGARAPKPLPQPDGGAVGADHQHGAAVTANRLVIEIDCYHSINRYDTEIVTYPLLSGAV